VWSVLAAPGPGNLVDVSFPTSARGYALDARGDLTRTDDGGDSWRLLDTGTYLKPRAVLAVDASTVLLVGPRGIRRSTKDGFGFHRIRRRRVATRVLAGGGMTRRLVFVYGPHALLVSPDAGDTWRAARIPRRGKGLVKVAFVSDSVAYALTRNGRLWKTITGGRAWHELSAIGTQLGTDLAFSDPSNGYVAVSQFGDDAYGYVMRTSDGGATWRPQLVDRSRIRAGALAAPATDVAFAASGAAHLLATETGGDIGEQSHLALSIRRRRPGRPGVIALSGTLTPARGGETVVVSRREVDKHWQLREVTVSSSGHFTVFSGVTKTTQFVAQWSGDDTRAGAGSALVTVRIGPQAGSSRTSSSRSASSWRSASSSRSAS
jgi:photosystem II stability/assembly factor-like uncharacterized protein